MKSWVRSLLRVWRPAGTHVWSEGIEGSSGARPLLRLSAVQCRQGARRPGAEGIEGGGPFVSLASQGRASQPFEGLAEKHQGIGVAGIGGGGLAKVLQRFRPLLLPPHGFLAGHKRVLRRSRQITTPVAGAEALPTALLAQAGS